MHAETINKFYIFKLSIPSINSIEEIIQNIEKLEGSSSSIEKQVTDIRKLSFKMKKSLNEEVLNLSKLL